MSSETITIGLSKTTLRFGIFGSIIFVLLGNWLIINAEVVGSSFSNGFILGIGLVCALFFAGTAIVGLMRLFNKKPGLQVDNQGITDNSNASSLGLIEWEDIISIRTEQVYSNKFIIINIRNQEKYLDQMSSWKKRILKANINKYDTPVSISCKTLKIDNQELEELLKQEFDLRN